MHTITFTLNLTSFQIQVNYLLYSNSKWHQCQDPLTIYSIFVKKIGEYMNSHEPTLSFLGKTHNQQQSKGFFVAQEGGLHLPLTIEFAIPSCKASLPFSLQCCVQGLWLLFFGVGEIVLLFYPSFSFPFLFLKINSNLTSPSILLFLPFLLVWMSSQNIGIVSLCLNEREMISVSIRIAAQRNISLQRDS